MIMSKPSKRELEDAVRQGLAYKKGGSYFPTPLAHALHWAQENITDPLEVPIEGIRYQGCLITKRLTADGWEIHVAEIKQ